MKCYIATYYKYDNYGTRLQNYALCQVLKDYNITPITLYLKDKRNIKNNVKNIMKKFIALLPEMSQYQKAIKNDEKKRKVFKAFNENLNLMKVNYSDLDKLELENAFAIAGSDQIWSPLHLKNNPMDIKLFFLKFVPECKRFSYAPSLGVDSITDNQKKLYKENITSFSKIALREESARNILCDIIDKEITLVPDPVFLLSCNEWRSKFNYINESKSTDSYILTYFLGEPNSETKKNITEIANNVNMKIINLSGNFYEKDDIVPAPDEFVKLIDKASLVFTDSFHACAFSIIMQTPFFVYQRSDVKQFTRIETLLKKFNCNECHITNKNFNEKTMNPLIYNEFILNKLKEEKSIGIKYLESILKLL
ncbi:polysaccharide pyruvyl transferase family protein [[Clostridium] innocuum]|nr:polysaccharide pyruvyl transferase family protein [[Clostridium] innocuum]